MANPELPLVSFLVVNYNYAPFLDASLGSLCAQTYPHWEAVVVDDGSTDESLAVISHWAERDARIRPIPQANGGVAAALNTAFRHAKGEFVLFLDSDDTAFPHRAERAVAAFAREPKAGMWAHALYQGDEQGAVQRVIPSQPPETGAIADVVQRRGGRWRGVPTSGLGFRREVLERLFPLPDRATLPSAIDAYLMRLAVLCTEVAFEPEPLGMYRIHGANMTGATRLSLAHIEKMVRDIERVNYEVQRAARRLDFYARYRVEENLNWLELTWWRSSLRPYPFVASDLSRLLFALITDDLYGTRRKLAGAVAALTIRMVRRAHREAWLNLLLRRP